MAGRPGRHESAKADCQCEHRHEVRAPWCAQHVPFCMPPAPELEHSGGCRSRSGRPCSRPRSGTWGPAGRRSRSRQNERFSSFDLAGLKDVDGLGELPGPPRAAAELAQDVPGFELDVATPSTPRRSSRPRPGLTMMSMPPPSTA
jgi:hypothetical protein